MFKKRSISAYDNKAMGDILEFKTGRVFRVSSEQESIGTILTGNQLLQLCTARTAWSDSVIRSETSLITESDQRGPFR